MVAPGFLQDPQVRRWLAGVEPAWTLLTFDSLNALRRRPSSANRALRLADDLTSTEISRSAVARHALMLLRRADEGEGLKLTATGNLSRAIVAEMIDRFDWPGFKREEAFRFHKVINEPDFLPLFFLRHIVQIAKLTRSDKGFDRPARLGRQFLRMEPPRSLQSLLFQAAFWDADLSYLGRDLLGSWPQFDIGVVLWSLSVSAADWRSPEQLTRMCTIPVNGVLESTWDTGSMATEARVLMPLYWFGLLEHRREDIAGTRFGERRFYRKSELFDRFVTFDVRLERPSTSQH